ncbi:pilus assembly protein PilP [Pseudobdellovibrio sp. HCB154]|uniref:pilus assembly protein PilP n=1 Tax=Pseudobdellovibrio sp. HCB154 TaxID=3386277 RepID=UPI0039176245
MKNIISLLKKSSLYLAAMMLALAATYYLGLAPLLHAQADFPDMPAFPEAKPTSPTAQPAAPPPGKPADIPDMPEDAAVAAPPAPPKPVAPPPPSRPNISPATGILFKHTKSYVGELSNPDRDPFRKPLYILELEEKSLKPQKTEEVRIDDKIEAIRRWPLRDYRLVGVIWDVKSPKAMIVDPSNTMHLLKRNYRIGDKDGIISAISEGTITVIQDNIPVVMDISSSGK